MSTKISEHGLIGNCRTAALIAESGDITWCCFPRFDSPSIFASILDEESGGKFSLRPLTIISSEQSYVSDSNVLQTTFTGKNGSARVIDGFTVMTEAEKKTELTPSHEIIRIVEGLKGTSTFLMTFEPRLNYGKKAAPLFLRKDKGIKCDLGHACIYLQTSLRPGRIKVETLSERTFAFAEFEVKAGEKIIFSLSYSDISPDILPCIETAPLRMEKSIQYWESWIAQCTYQGPYQDQVKRSALLLKLLSFAPSGAIIAAPTTSLPEGIGGVRNWDYRYCWLRDAAFTVRSFVAIGLLEEAKSYVNWLLHTTHLTRPRLQVLYNLYGESRIPEKILSWLSGHKDSRPVRIGNAAEGQFQLDVYGEVLNAIYYFAPSIKEFDPETRNFIIDIGNVVMKLWNCPDEGIWEVRSERVHHTHSKVMAWVALDRLIKLSERYHWKIQMEKAKKVKDEIRASIEKKGYNDELHAYTRSFSGTELDASVLVMPLVDYCSADDPRMQSTVHEVIRGLSKNGLIYRYRDVNDGLLGKEGTFNLCNLWLVQNLAKAGRLGEAKEWFENFLARSNPLGLWSEEIDPLTGDFLGNYPQAFTHTGLINAALTLSQEENKRRHA